MNYKYRYLYCLDIIIGVINVLGSLTWYNKRAWFCSPVAIVIYQLALYPAPIKNWNNVEQINKKSRDDTANVGIVGFDCFIEQRLLYVYVITYIQ